MPTRSQTPHHLLWIHPDQGVPSRRKIKIKESTGNTFNPGTLFGEMLQESDDYTWSKRTGLLGASVLLGLMASRTLSGQGDYTPTPQPVKQPVSAPQQAQVAPTAPDQAKPFQKEVLGIAEAKEYIAVFEGSKNRVYHDSAGKKTVGIGYNLDQPGAAKYLRALDINYTAVKSGRQVLTKAQIDSLFTRKVEDAMKAADRLLKTYAEQPKEVQLAVTDMIYNLGPSGFNQFDNVIDALNRFDHRSAAHHLARSEWRTQVGARAEKNIELIRNAGTVTTASNDLHRSVSEAFGEL